MESLFVPVVGSVIVGTVIVAECGFGVELEVGTDEFFSFGNSVDLITESAVVLVEEVFVSVCV